MIDNSQFINLIGIYAKHNARERSPNRYGDNDLATAKPSQLARLHDVVLRQACHSIYEAADPSRSGTPDPRHAEWRATMAQ